MAVVIDKVVNTDDFRVESSFEDASNAEYITLCRTIERLHLDAVLNIAAIVLGLLNLMESFQTALGVQKVSANF